MKILFKNTKNELVFTIDLNLETRRIEKVCIEEDRKRISKIYYPNVEAPSYDSLELLLNDYSDTNDVPLPKLLAHIKENGFYTPYRPTLRIRIE